MDNRIEFKDQIDIYRKDLPENFFSFGAYIKDGEAKHAVILIRAEGLDYICHFPGDQKPVLTTINEDTINKLFDALVYHISSIIDYTDTSMLYSTLAILQKICNSSDIKYSFIHDGSTYNADEGTFNSKNGLPELGSCVGFCLNAINTIISSNTNIDKYFVQLEDWPQYEPDDSMKRLDKWARCKAAINFPQLDSKSYETYHKRISPLEYLSLSYIELKNDPITKKEVDSVLEIVNNQISTLKKAV